MEHLARLLMFALTELRPAERLSDGASRITAAAVFSAAAVVALAAAFACLVAAGWIALIPIIGPAGAAASAGAGLALIAGIFWILARSRFSREHRNHHDAADPLATLQKSLNGLLGDDPTGLARRLWGENKVPLLLAALVAGMVLGGKDDPHRTGGRRD